MATNDEPADLVSAARRKLNAKTTKDTKCTRCKAPLTKGSRCCMFRERALSMREAQMRGTMYPMRLWCSSCVAPAVAK